MNETASSASAAATPNAWLAVRSLASRELVRFFRQPNRVVGAVGQPILFWFLLSEGFRSATSDGVSLGYQHFFPGMIVLILLFTAIFSTISIIEDRREGFLQSVLVSPVPRWAMVLGKVLGGTIVAFVQGLLFLALGLVLSAGISWTMILPAIAMMAVLSLSMTCLGFVIAWRMESTQGFHVVMNLVLMPMWLLSGAFFPADVGLLEWVVRLNPLTYGVAGLRQLLYWSGPAELSNAAGHLPSLPVCWAVTIGFALLVFIAAERTSAKRISGDLL
ncbi:MAG: ABC transporter permease [Pirellulales bacterium]|nr:ABC transporter permease [Pirellulales bacterium]